MLSAIILILLFIFPGFIAASVFQTTSKIRTMNYLAEGIIFDFLIFTINVMGLYFFRSVYTVQDLTSRFGWVSFCWKYALLSILMAIILGVILGIISRFTCRKK